MSGKAFAATSAQRGKGAEEQTPVATLSILLSTLIHKTFSFAQIRVFAETANTELLQSSQAEMEGGRIDPDKMDDSDSENTISDARSISENDTFDENHRLGVQNLR